MTAYFEQAQFTIPVLLGGIFTLIGLVTIKYPPRNINHLYGYRTPLSMSSQEHWDFAQQIAAKKMIQSGLFLISMGLINLLIITSGVLALVYPLILVFIAVIYLFLSVEIALKRKFPHS